MPEEAATNETSSVTRREFMWYAWISSIALFMAGSGGATIAYAYPRFKEGEFGGKFVAGKVEDFADGSVTPNREGKFFLVREGNEFKALYQVCTHLGCLVRQREDGFACPCHGSKFAEDGTLVASPAPRDMDQFAVEIVDGQVVVDTGTTIKGQNRQV
jgi:cytochrome b6-f complex iron-sulfur subunit